MRKLSQTSWSRIKGNNRTARSVDVILHVTVKNDARHIFNVFRNVSGNQQSQAVCDGDVRHLAASVLKRVPPMRHPTFPCGQGSLNTMKCP